MRSSLIVIVSSRPDFRLNDDMVRIIRPWRKRFVRGGEPSLHRSRRTGDPGRGGWMGRGVMIAGALLAAFALIVGCAPTAVAAGDAPNGAAVPLEGTTWSLVELGGQPARPAGTAGTPTLRLDAAQSRAAGNTGCNGYGGSYELSGASLRFGALASTRRACVDEAL